MNKKISAVMVVYNEEAVIERALQSVYKFADEIIIVHDGQCKDKTLEIAKKFTKDIFTLPHIGEAEPHRPFTYSKAKNNLILQLDADEFVPAETIGKLTQIIDSGRDFTSLLLNWKQYYNNEKILMGYKTIIFDKSKHYFIGVPHAWPKLLKNVEPKEIILNADLFNAPKYDNSSWEIFKTKWLKWKDIHAKYLRQDFSQINTWNYDSDFWDYPTNLIVKYPLFFGIPYTILSETYKLLRSLNKNIQIIKMQVYSLLYRLLLVKALIKVDK